MSGTRLLGVVLLAIGIALLVLAWNASQSVGEQLREALTGSYSDRTTWYLLGGIAAVVAGFLMSLAGGRARHA